MASGAVLTPLIALIDCTLLLNKLGALRSGGNPITYRSFILSWTRFIMGIVMGRRPWDPPYLNLIKMEGGKERETSLVSMIQAYLKWRYNSANL